MRLLYRSNPSKEEICYRLTTVSFGDKSSPFTSGESVTFLCDKFGDNFPNANETLRHDRYVDDIVQGSVCEQQLLTKYKEVSMLLKIGGFSLSKSWTNSPLLYDYILTQNVDELSVKAADVFNYDDEIIPIKNSRKN